MKKPIILATSSLIILSCVLLLYAGCSDPSAPDPSTNLYRLSTDALSIDSLSSGKLALSWSEYSGSKGDLSYRIYSFEDYSLWEGSDDKILNNPVSDWLENVNQHTIQYTPIHGESFTLAVKSSGSSLVYLYVPITYISTTMEELGDSVATIKGSVQDRNFLDIQLGSLSSRELYLIFSNPTFQTVKFPQVQMPEEILKKAFPKGQPSAHLLRPQSIAAESRFPPFISGLPQEYIDKFPILPPSKSEVRGNSILRSMHNTVAPTKLDDSVGDTLSFFTYSTPGEEMATCRSVVTAEGTTLSIWVADNTWVDGGTTTYKVNQVMVDHLADKFLKEGTNNDIFEWSVSILGDEWGAHNNQNLIPNTDEITILLHDTDSDDDKFNDPDREEGVIAGYFSSLDTYKRDPVNVRSGSNERIMFYIDAPIYAFTESGSPSGWDRDGIIQQVAVSTLAHELQHMINYYQKSVTDSGSVGAHSTTWIDEMCSLTMEDILAEKIQVNGPRGVDYYTASGGDTNNGLGRLPLFNTTNGDSLTSWRGTLLDYSTAYSFGALLMRNYGGPDLLRRIVQSEKPDYQSITEAIAGATQKNIEFPDLISEWGTAILLSDRTDRTPQGYNRGGWFQFTNNGMEFKLGSINFYNYSPKPLLYLPNTAYRNNEIQPTSNVFYQLGQAVSGPMQLTVSFDSDVVLSVVAKEITGN